MNQVNRAPKIYYPLAMLLAASMTASCGGSSGQSGSASLPAPDPFQVLAAAFFSPYITELMHSEPSMLMRAIDNGCGDQNAADKAAVKLEDQKPVTIELENCQEDSNGHIATYSGRIDIKYNNEKGMIEETDFQSFILKIEPSTENSDTRMELSISGTATGKTLNADLTYSFEIGSPGTSGYLKDSIQISYINFSSNHLPASSEHSGIIVFNQAEFHVSTPQPIERGAAWPEYGRIFIEDNEAGYIDVSFSGHGTTTIVIDGVANPIVECRESREAMAEFFETREILVAHFLARDPVIPGTILAPFGCDEKH